MTFTFSPIRVWGPKRKIVLLVPLASGILGSSLSCPRLLFLQFCIGNSRNSTPSSETAGVGRIMFFKRTGSTVSADDLLTPLITGTRRVRCRVPDGKIVSKNEQSREWLGTRALLRKLALTQILCWSVQLSHPPSPPHPRQPGLGLLLGSRRRVAGIPLPLLFFPLPSLVASPLILNHPG